MDTTENLLNNDLQIDLACQAHLKQTASWAKFISIVGIVGSVLLAIAGFFIGAVMSRYRSSYGMYSEAATFGSTLLTVVYVIAAVIIFFISLYLNRFATKMKTALETADQGALIQSFQNIKIYFRMIGIITIIYIALLLLGILANLSR